MAEAHIKLGYIVEPFAQFENTNGKPIVGGHLEVYIAGTDEKYITYQNFDFAQNPFKIPLGSDGRVVVLGDSELAYDVYAYDSFNNLVCSRLNVAAGDNGGLKEVLHDNTLTGKGTQLSPLGVSPLTNLAVDETMTAYSATVEGKDSLVLGVNGDWFNEQFGSAFSGKLDTSSFNSAFVGIKGELSSKVDWSAMSSYYDKDETYNIFMPRSAIDLNNYYTKNETYSQEEILTFLDRKQDKLTFGYNEYNEINSINNSAIAGGQGGSSGDETPWISGANIISSIGYIQPGQTIQAVSSMDLSGNKNHFIGLKGTKFIFPTVDMLSGWLELSGVMAQSSFDNFYSGAYQPAVNDLYNSANFNTTNKLDISSFNDWSATYAPTTPTYEVSAGDWIDVTTDDVEHVKIVSVTGLEEVISGASATLDNKIDEVSSTLTNEFSSFSSTITNDLTGKKDKQSYTTFTAAEGHFITGLEQDTNGEIVSASFGTYSEDSPAISSTELIGATKPMSGDMLIQVLSSISLSGDKNHGIIMEGNVYRFPNNSELASGINSTNIFLTQSAFSSYSNAITDNLSILYGQDSYLSGRIDNLITNKLDVSAFNAYTANDETYLLVGGNKIGISSNSATQETTIYFTGTNGDEEVNNVVRNFSANGTWLTSHQSLADYATKQWVENKGYITGVDLTPYQEKSGMTAYQPVSSMTGYYPMVGNPSGFLTTHQDISNKLDTTAFSTVSGNFLTAVDLTPYLTTADANTISSTLSGAITALSSEVPQLSAGEGIDITSSNNKLVITNGISAGENISLVYDSESNKIRIDCDITGDVGHTYSGIAPIQVNNTTDQISISGESLSAGPGIDMFASGDYVVISANDQSNCHCLSLNPSTTSVNLENYSAYDKLTILHAKEYGPTYEIHWDGKTKEIPSGLYIEMGKVKDINDLEKWTFLNSGWANNGWWDYD